LDEERSDDNAAADVAAAAAADLDAKADPPNDGGRKDQPKKRDSSKLQIQLINPQIRTNPQARKSIIQQMSMLLTDLHNKAAFAAHSRNVAADHPKQAVYIQRKLAAAEAQVTIQR